MRLSIPVAALFALALTVAARAQAPGQSLNMTLFDQLNPVADQGPHSALWGYTAPDGREYALFGSQIGTHIIDITNKPLKEVAFIPGPRTTWREMKVYKQYAYVVNDNTGVGIQIIDLSGLPGSATVVNEDTTYFHTSHTVYIRDHYMYIMGTKADAGINGGAMIFDLEPDPVHPVRVGQVAPYYYHDAYVRNDTLVGAAIYGQGCDIYDIRDKANPKHLATFNYPFSGTHNAELTPDGNYIATTDEIGSTPKTLKIWDIRDLDNITKVAEYTPNLQDIVHNVHFLGRYALVAWYTAGVRIIDMIDPRHPREVGFYDTYPGPSGSYNGVWEVFGAFPSGKIIASDRQTGLYVLNFNNTTAGSISGVVRNASTGTPIPNVTIRIAESGTTVTADAAGRYYIGGANGQVLSLRTNQFGYGGTNETITLAGDLERDLLLSPLTFFNGAIAARDTQGNVISGFSFAVEPYLHAVGVPGTTGIVSLPQDSTFTITVGKWGYAIARKEISLTGNDQTIEVTLRPGYEDDATLDLGWSYESPDDSATSGRWTRIVPYLPFAGADWFFPPNEPSEKGGQVFMTGAPPYNAPIEQSDINGGVTTLTSPAMDLSSYNNPTIRFQLWPSYVPRDTIVDDSLRIELSNDDGRTWVTAAAREPGWGGWMDVSVFPRFLLNLTDRMKIRFRASDHRSNDLVFAAMDDFQVYDAGVSGVDEVTSVSGTTIAVIPNPMTSAGGTIVLDLPAARTTARAELFDALGRRVRTLHDGSLGAGRTELRLDAGLPSGAYILRLTEDGIIRNLRVQLVR